ncbi:MAG: cytochrome C, partial [Cyclobacteriaceae bacterium]|nr:cytochrome C [Cyclobacteriaceae bacterium]
NYSYNHGAGMHRVITAAEFIKANMPFGQASKENPTLSDEEALLVAAYIDSFDRPLKSNPENDFPDKKLKPVSTPYGPWEDPFTAEQHKYGPYKPIMDYYDKEFGIKKNK